MTGPTPSSWWCTRCGGPAWWRGSSFSPGYALGECGRDEPCIGGLVPILADRERAEAVVEERRRARAHAMHQAHLRNGTYSGHCTACRVGRDHERHVKAGRHPARCELCIRDRLGSLGVGHAL